MEFFLVEVEIQGTNGKFISAGFKDYFGAVGRCQAFSNASVIEVYCCSIAGIYIVGRSLWVTGIEKSVSIQLLPESTMVVTLCCFIK